MRWHTVTHGRESEGETGEWSSLHTTSEHGVSSIITADAHNSAASSRLKLRSPSISMDSSVSPKDEIWFLRVCHHISNAVYHARSLGRYGYSLQTGRSGDRIPVGARFSTPVQTGPGDHPASCTVGTGLFHGIKRPGRGVIHPTPSGAEVKETVELYLYSLLCVFAACSRVTFTFIKNIAFLKDVTLG